MRPLSGLIPTLVLFAAGLAAQVPSRPEIVGAGKIEGLAAVLTNLSQHYFSGRWDLLQQEIDRLGLEKTLVGHEIDPKKNVYLVVFLSQEEGGDALLIRFLWHKPASDPYAARIPGKKEIFEIVLGAESDFDLKTTYFSSRRDNPLLAQIPKAAKIIEPALLALARAKGGPVVNCEVRKVVLPFERAKIKITDIAVLNEAEREPLEGAGAAGAKEIKASFEYDNTPLERLSFGLISAFLLGKGYAEDRIRLTDDDYYAADPPENPLTAVILNIHPLKYDPEAARMTMAERFRLLIGVVLNPDAGFCAGAGFGLLRGLSLDIGVALMGIPAANRPHAVEVNGRIKTVPGYPREPFRTSWKSVAFLGLGYNF